MGSYKTNKHIIIIRIWVVNEISNTKLNKRNEKI